MQLLVLFQLSDKTITAQDGCQYRLVAKAERDGKAYGVMSRDFIPAGAFVAE